MSLAVKTLAKPVPFCPSILGNILGDIHQIHDVIETEDMTIVLPLKYMELHQQLVLLLIF